MKIRLVIICLLLFTENPGVAQDICQDVRIYFSNYEDTDKIWYLELDGLMQLSLAGYEVCPDSEYHIDDFYVIVKGESIKNKDNGFDELNAYTRAKLKSLKLGDSFTVKANIRVIAEDESAKTFTIKRLFKLVDL